MERDGYTGDPAGTPSNQRATLTPPGATTLTIAMPGPDDSTRSTPP